MAPKTQPQQMDGTVDEDTGEIDEAAAVALVDDKFFSAMSIELPVMDPIEIQRQITGRVMKAESLDELFRVWEAKTSDQLVGKIVTIRSVDWSGYNASYGVIPLAKIIAYDEIEKKDMDFITTAPNLTSFIARAMQLQLLPFTAKIVGNQTRNGQTALHFERTL